MGKLQSPSLQNSFVELSAFFIFGGVVGGIGGTLYAAQTASSSEYVTLLSGFGGAVVGAAVSAVVSLLVAKQSANETLRRDLQTRAKDQQALALNLMIKSSLILSDIASIQQAIDESFSTANEHRLTHLPTWQRVLPIIGGHAGASPASGISTLLHVPSGA